VVILAATGMTGFFVIERLVAVASDLAAIRADSSARASPAALPAR